MKKQNSKKKKTALLTDEELIVRYRKDADKHWVGILYTRYAHLVLGLCFKYLGDKAKAEDATCDIFMSLYDKLKQHEVSNFRSWLYSLSRNHCLMQLRKEKGSRQVSLNGHEPSYSDDGLRFKALQEQKLELLEKSLDQLPDSQAKCLRLFYLQGKSYKQVVDATQLELKAVKSHIQNGKRKLKILLEQEDAFS